MIELLKEQVYHGNIVNSLDLVSGAPHPLLMELETVSDEHDDSMNPRTGGVTLMDQLALLQRQIESQQSQTTTVLNSSMRDVSIIPSYLYLYIYPYITRGFNKKNM